MLQKEGESPTGVIMVSAPHCTEWVQHAISKIEQALNGTDASINKLSQNAVELKSGEVITLEDYNLAVSFTYPNVTSRLMVMELMEPERVTFH